jgi:hypothetical protein
MEYVENEFNEAPEPEIAPIISPMQTWLLEEFCISIRNICIGLGAGLLLCIFWKKHME